MSPQEPLAAGPKDASFLAPSLLPRLPALGRVASADGSIQSINATDFDPFLPSNLVQVEGEYLVFKPKWQDPGDSDEQLSFATYRVDLNGYAGDCTLGFEWTDKGSPRFEGKYWIGLGDWRADRWRWFEGPLDNVLTLSTFLPYKQTDGQMLLAIAVLNPENVVLLHSINLGVAEQRNTGFVPETGSAGSKIPSLYAGDLPPAVDLSPGCSAVGDQGDWGACTAFAIGDGAFNYELGQLYASLGWTFSRPDNRTSPKHLYVESGKWAGLTAGPSQGRSMGAVAGGLVEHGVASSLSAPWDWVYDDDWPAAAPEEAELLRPHSITSLPCTDLEGIRGIKAVLAQQQRPVYCATGIDSHFSYYIEDTVWTYQGPLLSGHAVLIVGYDDALQAFRIRNSWGYDWGDGGYGWMNYMSLMNPSNTMAACGVLNLDYSDAAALRFTGQTAALSPPAGLSASDGSDPQNITLTWEAVSLADGYRIYRDTKDNLVAETASETVWEDSSVSDLHSHAYWVSSLSGGEESMLNSPDFGYLAQGPQVDSVSPQGGWSGSETTIYPRTSGSQADSYLWDFGGGASPNTSSYETPHIVLGEPGIYTASLTLSNSSGSERYEFELLVSQNRPPTCALSGWDISPAVPYSYNVDAREFSNDPDGQLVLYEWDWDGDGSFDLITSSPLASHTFTEDGQYELTLRVMDDTGQTAQSSAGISLVDTNIDPLAQFSFVLQDADLPVQVQFYADGSSDPDGFIILYEWDFDGDGTYDLSTTSYSCSHDYTTDCSPEVSLRVTDSSGGQAMTAKPVVIGIGKTEPGYQAHYVCQIPGVTDCRGYLSRVLGKPSFLLWRMQPGTSSIKLYFSPSSIPGLSADWFSPSCYSGKPRNAVLLARNNYPLVLVSNTDGKLDCAYANGPLGSWQTYTLEDSGVNGCVALSTLNAGVAIAYSKADLICAWSPATLPMAKSDWNFASLPGSGPVAENLDIAELGGRPLIGFGRSSGPDMQLAYASASSAQPGSADWSWYSLPPLLGPGDLQLNLLSGKPALLFSEPDGTLVMARAQNSAPADAGQWNLHSFAMTAPGSCTLSLDGSLPVTAHNALSPQGPQLASSKVDLPATGADWTLESLYGPDIKVLDSECTASGIALLVRQLSSGRVFYVRQTE